MSSDPGAELVEVVDEMGRVVEVVTRDEIRAGTLRHRCTYIAVATSMAELIVHQRADWKDVYPSYWDVCFGGIAGVGEPWEEAARRELAEEAGVIDVDLTDLGPVAYDDLDGSVVGRVYLARFDGPITCPDGEVVTVDQVPAVDIERWLADRQVCPDSIQIALPLILQELVRNPS